MNNVGQYNFRVYEDGKQIDGRDIDDPFLNCTIGFNLTRWDAFKAIFRPLVKRYNVIVGGTGAAHRVVFNSEYVKDGG